MYEGAKVELNQFKNHLMNAYLVLSPSRKCVRFVRAPLGI